MSQVSKVSTNDLQAAPSEPRQKGQASKKPIDQTGSTKDQVGVSTEGKEKAEAAHSEKELLARIDFDDGSDENLERFRDLVKTRIQNGYYGRQKQPGKGKSEIEIAKQMAGRSFRKS